MAPSKGVVATDGMEDDQIFTNNEVHADHLNINNEYYTENDIVLNAAVDSNRFEL